MRQSERQSGGIGEHPILFSEETRACSGMQKTGNGNHVRIEQFLDDLKAVVRDGEELLKVGATEAKRRAVLGAQVTDRRVREHPYQSIGIVFGLGLLVGILASSLIRAGGAEEEEAEMEELER
jgi:ElaB/YqjD/DUF883 family membrane-anchored ribosome-binding protein